MPMPSASEAIPHETHESPESRSPTVFAVYKRRLDRHDAEHLDPPHFLEKRNGRKRKQNGQKTVRRRSSGRSGSEWARRQREIEWHASESFNQNMLNTQL